MSLVGRLKMASEGKQFVCLVAGWSGDSRHELQAAANWKQTERRCKLLAEDQPAVAS